jgi:hypothetical protein
MHLIAYRMRLKPSYRTRSLHLPLGKTTIGDPPVRIDRCCRNSRLTGINLAGARAADNILAEKDNETGSIDRTAQP